MEDHTNAVAGGLKMYHFGDFTHISKNYTILIGVVFGNKYEDDTTGFITVGDNCYFGCGLGTVTIGNNVIVGTNSVVTKDVPDNAIIGDSPAKNNKI